MKILLKILNWIKNYYWVFLIAFVLIFFFTMKYWYNQAQKNDARADRWKSNHDELQSDFKQTKDKLGRTETQVKEYKITINELQSDLYQKNGTLKELREELQYSEAKIKDLQESLVSELKSSNEGQTIIRDTILEKKKQKTFNCLKVNDGFLDFEAYWLKKDSVDWFYEYSETIYYWTMLKRDIYNDKGNKRFFLWRVWPLKLLLPKVPETKVKSINPNSKIQVKEFKIVK